MQAPYIWHTSVTVPVIFAGISVDCFSNMWPVSTIFTNFLGLLLYQVLGKAHSHVQTGNELHRCRWTGPVMMRYAGLLLLSQETYWTFKAWWCCNQSSRAETVLFPPMTNCFTFHANVFVHILRDTISLQQKGKTNIIDQNHSILYHNMLLGEVKLTQGVSTSTLSSDWIWFEF